MYTIIHRWLNIATPRVTNPTELETVKAPTRSLVALACIRTTELCCYTDIRILYFPSRELIFFNWIFSKKKRRKKISSTAIRNVGTRYLLECSPTIEQSRLWLRVCMYTYICMYTQVCNGLNVWDGYNYGTAAERQRLTRREERIFPTESYGDSSNCADERPSPKTKKDPSPTDGEFENAVEARDVLRAIFQRFASIDTMRGGTIIHIAQRTCNAVLSKAFSVLLYFQAYIFPVKGNSPGTTLSTTFPRSQIPSR